MNLYEPSAHKPPHPPLSTTNARREPLPLPRSKLPKKKPHHSNLQVWLGIYIDSNSSTYTRQRDEVISAIQTFGTNNVAGITVGNEYV